METFEQKAQSENKKSTAEYNRENIHKHLCDWLRDAYAMEHQAIEMLEREEERIKHYPELKSKVTIFLANAKHYASKLEEALDNLGTCTSTIKTGLGKVVGAAQAWSGVFMPDEIVKASVALYIFAHYGIGNYKVIIEAAEEAGYPEIVALGEEITSTKQEMAEWMLNYLPQVTRQFFHHLATGTMAKH